MIFPRATCLTFQLQLLTDLHCQQSEARKSLLNLNFRKELKDVILEARSDEFLFGKNLSDRIKEAKAMERSGLDLKQKKTSTLQRKPFSQNQGNYKSPPKRRPPPRLGGQTSILTTVPKRINTIQAFDDSKQGSLQINTTEIKKVDKNRRGLRPTQLETKAGRNLLMRLQLIL
ncbi:uncharacterized protein LOC116158864 [Photinus pyralis]|uniref:uncharacterized protein LOC116158864 n=1 Tax=Photinus pyralis TaxID=7054 RepID=UPI00126707FD|nr:uncharacterized protein LOC116158864 [Photinus pyralis]